jgi:hypothetical protein
MYRAGPVPPGTSRTGPVPTGFANPGCTNPYYTFYLFMVVVQPCTKHMAYRSRLVQFSSKKDYSPNCFSKEAVKEEVLNILIPIATNTLLTFFPIFPSQVVFG